MPCDRIEDGIVCTGNEVIFITYHGKAFFFEWTAASGWCPVNKDGSGRVSRVPNGAWDKFLHSSAAQARHRYERLKGTLVMTADSAIFRIATQIHPTEINVVLAREVERLREEREKLYKKIEKLEQERKDDC